MLNEDSLKIIGEKTDKEFIDNYNAINQTAKILLNKGLVKESYIEAIKKREESFPTGLKFENYGIAIPHTDPEHVINEAILINILEKPIKFEQMASEGLMTDVNIIIMLAIKNKENQVPYLQALIEIFQDKEKIDKLLESENNDIIEKTFIKYLKEIM